MTQKDFIKVELISFGYDRNIIIDSFIGEDGCRMYDISAENIYGDAIGDIGSFLETLVSIHLQAENAKKRHKDKNIGYIESDLMLCPLKTILNDTERESILRNAEKRKKMHAEMMDAESEIEAEMREWSKENDPCSWECLDNKRDYKGDGGMWFNCINCATGGVNTNCEKINAYRKRQQEWIAELLPKKKEAWKRIEEKYDKFN